MESVLTSGPEHPLMPQSVILSFKIYVLYIIRASSRKNLSFGFENKGADQPAHHRSLISAFAILLIGNNLIYTCYMQTFNFLAYLCS